MFKCSFSGSPRITQSNGPLSRSCFWMWMVFYTLCRWYSDSWAFQRIGDATIKNLGFIVRQTDLIIKVRADRYMTGYYDCGLVSCFSQTWGFHQQWREVSVLSNKIGLSKKLDIPQAVFMRNMINPAVFHSLFSDKSKSVFHMLNMD